MRAFAILILNLAFVAAVILPNEVGTHELPATGCKCLKRGKQHAASDKAATCCNLVQGQSDLSPTSDTQLIVSRSVKAVAREQLSLPLLI